MTTGHARGTAGRFRVRIERVILEGFAFTPQEVRLFEAALTGELIRLLRGAAHAPTAGARAAGSAPALVTWHDEGKPDVRALGRRVAASVHEEIVR